MTKYSEITFFQGQTIIHYKSILIVVNYDGDGKCEQ